MSTIDIKQGKSARLKYSHDFGAKRLKLLEVSEAMLEEVLANGVSIKGRADGEAVLCTQDKTYALKNVESSNTILLVPPRENHEVSQDGSLTQGPADKMFAVGSQGREPSLATQYQRLDAADCGQPVVAITSVTGHMEVVEMAPRLGELEALLQAAPHPFTAEECMGLLEDADQRPRGYTTEELQAAIQASDVELEVALEQLGAVELGGRWRLLSEPLFITVLDMIVCTAVEKEWALGRVPGGEVARALAAEGYPEAVTLACLRTCSKPAPPLGEAGADPVHGGGGEVALQPEALCVYRARHLLGQSPRWRLGEFMDALQRDMPSSMPPSIEMLRGEVLVEEQGVDTWVQELRASKLSRDPGTRFAALFKHRAAWQLADLQPFLEGLKGPGLSVETLLLKFTRTSQPNKDAPKMFSAR